MTTGIDYLKENGFEIIDTEGGNVVVKDKSGNVGDLNTKTFLKDTKLKEFNNKDTPVEKSYSLEDAFRVGLGNIPGTISFLKNKYGFEKVIPNQAGDIVGLKDGIWTKFDKAGVGEDNYMQMAKELASDVVFSAARYGLQTGGAVQGATMGGPAGAAAGAALGEGARTVLGRLAGTYEGSPETMAKDMLIEGGSAFVGTKYIGPVLNKVGGIVKAGANNVERAVVKGLAEGLEYANPGIKNATASILQFATGASEGATSILTRFPKAVMGQVSEMLEANSGKAFAETVQNVRTGSINKTYAVARDVARDMYENYGKQLKSIFDDIKSPFDFKLETPDLKSLKAIMFDGGTINGVAVDGLANNPFIGRMLKEVDGKYVLKSMSELIKEGITTEEASLIKNSQGSLKKVLNLLYTLPENSKAIAGKEGFTFIKGFQESLDDIVYNHLSANPALQMSVKEMVSPFRNLTSMGLSDKIKPKYGVMQKWYLENVEAIGYAKNLGQHYDPSKLEKAMLDALSPDLAKTTGAKEMFKHALNIGNKEAKEVLASEAGLQFAKAFPHIRNLASGPGLLVGAAAGGALISDDPVAQAISIAAPLALLSPRVSGKIGAGITSAADTLLKKMDSKEYMPMIQKTVDAAYKLPGGVLMKNDDMFEAFVGPLMNKLGINPAIQHNLYDSNYSVKDKLDLADMKLQKDQEKLRKIGQKRDSK